MNNDGSLKTNEEENEQLVSTDPPPVNPMMNDFLSYLKNAFQKSSKPKEEPRNAVSADNSN